MMTEPLVTTAAPVDESEDAVRLRAAWVEGYEWALLHLDDEGVQADAQRLKQAS